MTTADAIKPRISTPWRLRNDGRNTVAYSCIRGDLRFRVLTPWEASIVPFFDGSLDLSELRKIWLEIHPSSNGNRDKLLKTFDQVYDSLASKSGIITPEGELSPSLSMNRDYLIPNAAQYSDSVERLQYPLSVNIAITNGCRCHCHYCYAELRRCPEMEIGQLCELFDELVSHDIFLVDVVGGDLFTRADAIEILTEMVARDFVFFLSTKSYISENVAGRLAELGIGLPDMPPHLVRSVQVSVDSTVDSIASYLVGQANYLQQATQSIKNLTAAGIAPRVKCVLTAFNADAAEGLIRYFADLGVNDFQFVQYGRSYYRHDDALFLSLEAKLRLSETKERMCREYPNVALTFQDDTSVGGGRNRQWSDWHNRSVCSAGRTNLQIQPNGDVTLCDQVPHADQYVMGNVLKQSIHDIWNSQRLVDFLYPPREHFEGTACLDCPEFDACHHGHGYCFRDSLFSYGTIYEAPPDCPRQYKTPPRQI